MVLFHRRRGRDRCGSYSAIVYSVREDVVEQFVELRSFQGRVWGGTTHELKQLVLAQRRFFFDFGQAGCVALVFFLGEERPRSQLE